MPVSEQFFVTPLVDSILQFGERVHITFTFPIVVHQPAYPVFILPFVPYIYVDYAATIQQTAPNTIESLTAALPPDTVTYVAVTHPESITSAESGKPIKYLGVSYLFPVLYRYFTRPGTFRSLLPLQTSSRCTRPSRTTTTARW